MHLKANLLMKRNVDALLRARGQTRRDLARWCHRGDAWIAKIMAEDHREFPMKYFDRIADFFGIATYQLLQPGITPLTERRKSTDRRTGQDRRVSRAMLGASGATDAELLSKIRPLLQEEREKLWHWIDVVKLGRDDARTTPRRRAPTAATETPADGVGLARKRKQG